MKFKIAGGDNACYGDLIGPAIAHEMGMTSVDGWNDGLYMVLKLDQPLTIKDEQIQHLTIAPRYKGDDFEKIRKEECVVGIGIIKGKLEQVPETVSKDRVEYYAVGTSTPVP